MNTDIPDDFIERMGIVSAAVMYRLCEVDSVVKGCGALIEAARNEFDGGGRSEELTALSYLLTMASKMLMEHWEYVDVEMSSLRRQLAAAQEACVKP